MDLLHTPAVRQSVAPPEGWGCGRQWHICKEAWLGGLGRPWRDEEPWTGQQLVARRRNGAGFTQILDNCYSMVVYGDLSACLLLVNTPRGPCVLLLGVMCLRLARGPG